MTVTEIAAHKKLTLSDIETEIAHWKPIRVPLASTREPLLPESAESPAPASRLRGAQDSNGDALLGIGHLFSRLAESVLLQRIAPRLQVIGAGLGRAVGGLGTAVFAGVRVVNAAKQDLAAGNRSLPSARQETVVSMGGIAAGMVVGEAGYLLAAAATAISAPAVVVGGVLVGTVIAAGYAASWARNALGKQYSAHK